MRCSMRAGRLTEMPFFESTAFEAEILRATLASGEMPTAAVHRIKIVSAENDNVSVTETTNDDDDDGLPDGHWETWRYRSTRENALKHAGKCRVGISGVIVTVTLDGKEVR